MQDAFSPMLRGQVGSPFTALPRNHFLEVSSIMTSTSSPSADLAAPAVNPASTGKLTLFVAVLTS
ncbi:hypothetical protein [Bradyrhizobium sp. JR3.5]